MPAAGHATNRCTVNAFRLLHPATLHQALANFAGNAAWLAGGQALLPAIARGEQSFDTLIDISALTALRGMRIAEDDGTHLHVGALTSAAELAASPLLRRHIPGLVQMAAAMARRDPRSGTLGGAIAGNEPGSDVPAALLALDAAIVTSHGVHGAEDFFEAADATPLADGELITGIDLRIPERSGHASAIDSHSERTTVFVARFAEGHCVARTAPALAARRWPAAETALNAGRQLPATGQDSPFPDLLIQAMATLR